ncbi:hypothetical protein AN958_04163 [Leucoagaricus sp. SymC.cos]|nr:hypothetical protein AN958_04163 [Leucoagaricus sp. SymC.cos]
MAATIMDSYDAQMLDYQNDLDVQMHLSSSDPWLQDVIPMEDDAHLAFHQKGAMSDSIPTIEVDMEAYVEDDHVEYEMVDDHQSHNPTPGELLDVDVLDASAVPSPLVSVTPLPTISSAEPSQPQPSTETPQSEHSTPAAPSAVEEHQRRVLSDSSELVTVPGLDTAQALDPTTDTRNETPLPLQEFIEPSTQSLSEEVTAHESTPQPTVRADEALGEESHTVIPAIRTVDTERANSHPPDTDQPSAEPISHIFSSEMLILHGNAAETFLATSEVAEHTTSEQTSSTDKVTGVDSQISHSGSSVEPSSELTGNVEVAAAEQAMPNVRSADHTTETSNEVSHEAHEEIHLDTPPPILLSIFSTDHPELCLFNKPSEPLPDEDDTQERHILFQQAAPIFYEPLVNAFEALRQDEYVSTVLEVNGNELALEAYELDLAITEDNYYGREISLHDIYALHTSANLAGPLRLRLYISGTRFIVRYHMLQEGLINLHVDESEGSNHDGTDVSQHDDHQDDGLYEQDETLREARLLTHEIALEIPEKDEREEEELVNADEYQQVAREDSEAVDQTGEIDLSALPPFVDSPEPHDEDEHDENGQDVNSTLTTQPPFGVSEDDASGDGSQSFNGSQTESTVPNTTVPEVLAQSQEDSLTAEETSSEQQNEYPEDDIHATEVKADDAESVDALHEPQTETVTSEHITEHSERTPQPEPTGSTNDESIEHIQETLSEKDKQDILGEGSLSDQFVGVDSDTHAIEELQDFDADAWDDELDGEGDPDTTWEAEKDNGDESISNESSVTLSSKASKRSYDDFGLEHSDDKNLLSESPDPKRARVV